MTTFVSASETTKYAASSTGVRQPLADRSLAPRPATAPAARVPRPRPPAPPREGASGESRARARAARRSPPRPRPARARARRSRRVAARRLEAERDGERDEPLLGAVVEVALDPPPLGVGRGDDPAARRAYLGELGAHLGGETLVLEHQPRGCRTDSTSAGSSSNAGSWTSAATSSPRAVTGVIARSGPSEARRVSGGVDVAAVTDSIGNLERRVAEYAGEAFAQRGRRLGRSSTTRSDASARRSRDQSTPPTSAIGSEMHTARPSVSRVGLLESLAITAPSQMRPTTMVDAVATKNGPCERTGAAEGAAAVEEPGTARAVRSRRRRAPGRGRSHARRRRSGRR